MPISRPWSRAALLASAAVLVGLAAPRNAAADPFSFTAGDLVVSTVTCSVAVATCNSTGAGLDTASPITLQEFQLGSGGTTATSAGSLTLTQTQNGANAPISGEYGSASEGFLQLSANGQYLTIMGYGVNANTFNNAAGAGYGTEALGQTTSINNGNETGTGGDTTVPRVVALIGGDGSVNTTTALTGVFNENNPRSAATVNGSSFYVSGQGQTGDGTGGVFYAVKGATTATPIDANTSTPSGADTVNAATGTETRAVEISSVPTGTDTLYVSRDFSPKGTPNDSTDIRSLTNQSGGLPTSSNIIATRLTNLNTSTGKGGNTNGGNDSSINVTSGDENGVNNSRKGAFVYLSPEQFFFANATTMYVTDSGQPKNGSSEAAALGEGGLQKWSLVGGVWELDYDLVSGLNLVDNSTANSATPAAKGVTGLFGLTGEVVGGQVELFATSYGLNELSSSYLYEITDTLSDTTLPGSETFTTLESAPADTMFRGVSLAPAPEPASIALLASALAGLGLLRRRTAKV